MLNKYNRGVIILDFGIKYKGVQKVALMLTSYVSVDELFKLGNC